MPRRPRTLAEDLWVALHPTARRLVLRVAGGLVLLAVLSLAQCVFGPLPRRR